VISRSPTDLQPVFDTIVASAVQLCGGHFGTLHRFEGYQLDLTAHHNCSEEVLDFLRRTYPRPPDPHSLSGRAIRERRVVQIADIEAGPEVPSISRTATSSFRCCVKECPWER
jgi:hypothetical protein